MAHGDAQAFPCFKTFKECPTGSGVQYETILLELVVYELAHA